ncbi:hypothetical protein Q3G72_008972 [Acer saccharum]|nr:hypothetical protein Q3G72_008972 [Acer saccharum]
MNGELRMPEKESKEHNMSKDLSVVSTLEGVGKSEWSLTIEMLIGSYSGDDRVKRCRKGTFLPFSAAHAAHQAGAPSAVQQAPVKSLFRGPCRSRGKCLLSGTPSEPFQSCGVNFSAAHARAYPAAR